MMIERLVGLSISFLSSAPRKAQPAFTRGLLSSEKQEEVFAVISNALYPEPQHPPGPKRESFNQHKRALTASQAGKRVLAARH